jgi:hypothetical protein
MANFPLVTWQVDLPAFDVNGNPTTAQTGVWGFGVTTTLGDADPASIAGVFAAQVVAAGGATSANGIYQYTNNVSPALGPMTYLVAFTGGPFTCTFASLADAALYGFDSLTVTFSSSPSAVTPFNPAGVWMPCGVSGDVTRTTKQRAAASSSDMSGLSTDVVNWGQVADIEVKSTLFPAANAFRWYATQAIYAQKAGRDANDPNNILEKMLEAAATGVTFRIYEEAATTQGVTNADYLVARMPGVVDKNAAASVLQADDEPRLWSTTGLFFRGED